MKKYFIFLLILLILAAGAAGYYCYKNGITLDDIKSTLKFEEPTKVHVVCI